MRKQNENHLYKYETKMTQDIKNMTIYIEWSAMKKIVWHTSQRNKKSTIFKHQKNITKNVTVDIMLNEELVIVRLDSEACLLVTEVMLWLSTSSELR